MDTIISTRELSFSYKKTKVVKGLSLSIPQGSVYGFLGPNGAGKSTTIRILLGLLKPENGEVNIFNRSLVKDRSEILSQIGNIIEGPSFYEHLSAQENLTIHCVLRDISKKRINDVLEIVDLQHQANKKVKAFSMGMKQRLSIASALIHDPEILVLDEPTNGLDPQGIMAMRQLIMKLNKVYGKTIFISSHLLSEIELMCNHIGIIKNGELVYQNSIEHLQSLKHSSLLILDGVEAVDAEFVKTIEGVKGYKELSSEKLEITLEDNYNIKSFVSALCKIPVRFEQIYKKQHRLEDLFLTLTKA